MPSARSALVAATSAVVANAASLSDICTTSYAAAALPADAVPGITIDSSSLTTAIVSNSSVTSEWYPSAVIDYCNVTFAYSHNGLTDDIVHVSYLLPAPDSFEGRYVSTGGGGLAINSGSSYSPSGIIVGAVSGITDGGFGNFDTQFDAVFLAANDTINWQATYMFGYQAHHELAVLGKAYTANLYNVTDKVYSYYQGCSEGGREGWSQVQRFADQFDGAAIGAPAFRYGQQQVNHLSPAVIQQDIGYTPPPCALETITNLTIAFCDPLDGLTDGVIARSDLCLLQMDFNSTVGKPYSCAATAASAFGSAVPAQNGSITAQDAANYKAVIDGLHDSDGKRVYINFQIGSDNTEAESTYDSTTGTWAFTPSGLGGEWVARFLELQDADNIDSLTNVTADTLRNWMSLGMNRYYDSLQTNWPDLSAVKSAGTKVIHLHGEQDNSIPTASSVHYYESVRNILYPDMGFNESTAAMDEFYRLFLVPGGAHCMSNTLQANGGWPQDTLQQVIDWVENDNAPATLNNSGTVITELCSWPLRPLWSGNGTSFDCVYDQSSIDSWMYEFDAFNVPIY
ncbi:hypothetical protein N0V82_002262 [Gnomoniopsis sp. IMI 355080]|nr:hypothetical protein N0V82_002262 [Gnomoniopsis sp. IMI 355080]